MSTGRQSVKKAVELSIIIVNYNTETLLRDCLASVIKHARAVDYEIIVVDNASSDGSVAMVKKEFPKVTCISNSENEGFSKANNRGVRLSQGRYVLFLNSDTLVPEKTLPEMCAFMERTPEAGAATCFVELSDGSLDDAAHRGFPTPWNAFCHFSGIAKLFPKSLFFNGYNLGWRALDRIDEIDALAGAFMLVRRQAGIDAGWWDEDYFFYGEDLDFCFMLKQKGWKIYFVPDVRIKHFKGVSSGIKKISQNISPATLDGRKRVTEARFSAMEIFYKKHYLGKYPGPVTWFVIQGIRLMQVAALRSL